MKEVCDGWAHYHARIEEKENKKKIKKYRYVVYRRFAHTEIHKTGWWIKDRDKVVKRATRYLDSVDMKCQGEIL